MPRGRHRHSPPLHRLLPPVTVAGASLACASGVWFVGDDLAQRVLATGAAAAAVTGSVLLRAWDRTAGKSVAELKNARLRDEWKTDERIAELETDLEESRGIRGKLDTKLRSKRAELARLRSEHAELLRRYATAETERASALEGRRLLAIETGSPARELTAGSAAGPDGSAPGVLTAVMYHRAAEALRQLPRNAARQAESAQARDGEDGQGNPGAATERPAAHGRARTAAAPKPGGPKPGARKRGAPEPAASGPAGSGAAASGPADSGSAVSDPAASGTADAAVGAAADATVSKGAGKGADTAADTAIGTGAGKEAGQRGAGMASGLRSVPAAAAVIAPVRAQRLPASRVQGGFDFFGTATGTGAVPDAEPRTGPGTGVPSTVSRRPKPVRELEEDLADVVGDEAVAEQSALGRARTTDEVQSGKSVETGKPVQSGEPGKPVQSGKLGKPGKGRSGVKAEAKAGTADGETAEDADAAAAAAAAADADSGEVIDLTAHDETEQIDMAELRSAVSS
ncbi:hypothetical protein [Streptomyces sp. NPDC018045]|uniref:hypothetical protein n=1 Tax=Streptomyces sp. NPDC018045 TaxID=3365037 RepID=UPI0037B1BA30